MCQTDFAMTKVPCLTGPYRDSALSFKFKLLAILGRLHGTAGRAQEICKLRFVTLLLGRLETWSNRIKAHCVSGHSATRVRFEGEWVSRFRRIRE